jgi:hypothetical protein
MGDVSTLLAGADRLTSLFGYWPSFHDSEVIEVRLRRDEGDGKPSLTATIHVFEMTREVSATGHFVCRHHVLVTLHFSNVSHLEADGFNHQNALAGLVIEDAAAPDQYAGTIRVAMEGAYGFDCEFYCHAAAVVDVVPGIPHGSVYAR